jgi:hypothetical protein
LGICPVEDKVPERLMAKNLGPLERKLTAGEVHFDAFTRGRHSIDASHDQIMPLGIVAPRTIKEADWAISISR